MKEITESGNKKINRKKFFVYFTSFAAGVYGLTKLPADFIKTKFEEENSKNKRSVSFTGNPFSVKRSSGKDSGKS